MNKQDRLTQKFGGARNIIVDGVPIYLSDEDEAFNLSMGQVNDVLPADGSSIGPDFHEQHRRINAENQRLRRRLEQADSIRRRLDRLEEIQKMEKMSRREKLRYKLLKVGMPMPIHSTFSLMPRLADIQLIKPYQLKKSSRRKKKSPKKSSRRKKKSRGKRRK